MLTSNLGDLLRRRSLRNPGIEAVVDLAAGTRITYAELNERVNRVANTLLERGVKPGDRVGLLAATSAQVRPMKPDPTMPNRTVMRPRPACRVWRK